jgi:hypothetical protein
MLINIIDNNINNINSGEAQEPPTKKKRVAPEITVDEKSPVPITILNEDCFRVIQSFLNFKDYMPFLLTCNQWMDFIKKDECSILAKQLRALKNKNKKKINMKNAVSWSITYEFLDSKKAKELIQRYCNYNTRLNIKVLKDKDLSDNQKELVIKFMTHIQFRLQDIAELDWCNPIHSELLALFSLMKQSHTLTTEIIGQVHRYSKFARTAQFPGTIQNQLIRLVKNNPKEVQDRVTALLVVTKDAMILRLLDYWKDDEEVVKAAISRNGYAYNHASPRLQANKEIAMMAIRRAPSLFCQIGFINSYTI